MPRSANAAPATSLLPPACRRQIIMLAAVAAAWLAVPGAARAGFVNLLANGSFESGTVAPQQNIPVGSTGITGWTVINGPIDYMDSASGNPFVNVWTGADGTRS